MKKSILGLAPFGVLLSLASPSLLSAGTFYVPNPVYGGPKAVTELEIGKTEGGPEVLAPIFIATGRDGTSLFASPVNVNNNAKPDVFSVARFITGSGMLKLVGDPGITVPSASVFLSSGADTYPWALPVVTSANWFKPGETAYLQNLARNSGGFSNLEIMTFGSSQASCQYQLRRPLGSAIGPPKSVAVKPESHLVVNNVLQGLVEVANAAGVRAEVKCNQPFYAYATFVSANPKNFRFLYPFDTAPLAYGEAVNLNLPGVFFQPVQGRSELLVDLPLVPERGYRKATIEFEMNVTSFSPVFSSVVGMYRDGGPRFNKTLYFGSFIRGNRKRSMIDQGSPVVEPSIKVNTAWQQGANYRVVIVYDAENATLRFQALQGTRAVLDVTGSAYNLDLANRDGSPVKLAFGLRGVADNAYYPPWGWRFSNLKVKVER